MLSEFGDIIVDDLPNELPPIRKINHHMDFILGVSFPNKTAYKMTPQKNEEIRKQGQELLDKGLIRESLSPCVIPIVLAPKKNEEWRMCTNSKETNRINLKYIFPFPRMDAIMDCFSEENYFINIELKSGYH